MFLIWIHYYYENGQSDFLSIISRTFFSWHSTIKKAFSSVFHFSFIYTYITANLWILIVLNWINPLVFVLFCFDSLCSRYEHRLPLQAEFCILFLCLLNSLLCRIIRCSSGIWYCPCSRLALRRMTFKSQNLGARCVRYYWVQFAPVTLSVDRTQKYMYVYITHIHTYTHTHF